MPPDAASWIGADAAARALGVTRATLYAYVSRGFVRSQSGIGSSRRRAYSRDDIERLRRRTDARRHPDTAAARALEWGMPILESSIALIDGVHLYYRGHDAVELARTRSIAEVASLVWTGTFDGALTTADSLSNSGPVGPVVGRTPVASSAEGTRGTFVPRAQAALAMASADDPLAFDLRRDAVARCGWRIITRLASIAVRSPAPDVTIDRALARAWHLRGGADDLVRRAVILCADHELNVSSFTARCVASAGSNPYAVVIAGLAALEGTRHGGVSARVEALLDGLRRRRSLPAALGERLARGEAIDGFGHPLYRAGDPRATALLEMLRERYPKSSELEYVSDVAAAAASVVHEQPTIDFALAAIARVLHLPPGSPLTLFAIGRTIGWVGHAIEQYATGQLIRPRAKYVGPPPHPSVKGNSMESSSSIPSSV